MTAIHPHSSTRMRDTWAGSPAAGAASGTGAPRPGTDGSEATRLPYRHEKHVGSGGLEGLGLSWHLLRPPLIHLCHGQTLPAPMAMGASRPAGSALSAGRAAAVPTPGVSRGPPWLPGALSTGIQVPQPSSESICYLQPFLRLPPCCTAMLRACMCASRHAGPRPPDTGRDLLPWLGAAGEKQDVWHHRQRLQHPRISVALLPTRGPSPAPEWDRAGGGRSAMGPWTQPQAALTRHLGTAGPPWPTVIQQRIFLNSDPALPQLLFSAKTLLLIQPPPARAE